MHAGTHEELTKFDRNDESHINMVKGLYYAWYGPKDAKEYLASKGISITTSQITNTLYNFRAAHLPRADRSHLVEEYITSLGA